MSDCRICAAPKSEHIGPEGRCPPIPVSTPILDDLSAQISKLLGDDPICGGRVCDGTVEAIAALVRPAAPEPALMVTDEAVERIKFVTGPEQL